MRVKPNGTISASLSAQPVHAVEKMPSVPFESLVISWASPLADAPALASELTHSIFHCMVPAESFENSASNAG